MRQTEGLHSRVTFVCCAPLPLLGVLGNHDTIRMLPALEAMGIRMLQNECEKIKRGDQEIFVAGIDDAHYFRVDNIEKAGSHVPDGAFSILLSHTRPMSGLICC